jgi:hypothetical protein
MVLSLMQYWVNRKGGIMRYILTILLFFPCFLFSDLTIDWNTWLVDLPIPSGLYNGSCITFCEENADLDIPAAVYYLVYDPTSQSNKFYKYQISPYVHGWIPLEPLPGPSMVGAGTDIAVAYHYGNGYPIGIYAIKANNTSEFWGFDFRFNSWGQSSEGIPNPHGASQPFYGSRFIDGGFNENGNHRCFFLRGNNSSEFWMLQEVRGTGVDAVPPKWIQLQDIPSEVTEGTGLTYVPDEEAVYALPCMGIDDFWRYDIAKNSWAVVDQYPANHGAGLSIEAYSSEPLILAFDGYQTDDHDCRGYWTDKIDWELTDHPPNIDDINPGSDMTYGFYSDGLPALYAIFGGGQSEFYWGRVIVIEELENKLKFGGKTTSNSNNINSNGLKNNISTKSLKYPTVVTFKSGAKFSILKEIQELSIYDNLGNRVETLCCDSKQEVFWKPLRPGVFFLHTKTSNNIIKGKLVVLP